MSERLLLNKAGNYALTGRSATAGLPR